MFNRRPALLNRNVLVNLRSGNAISAVCVYASRESLVLRGATVHQPDSEPAAADGEVLVDRSNVDFIQLL